MVTSAIRSSIFVFALLSVTLLAQQARAQAWNDSLSADDRFWSRSGGGARELSLGSGGFGMLGDSGVRTLSVNPFSVDPLFMLQNPAYASRYPGYLWFDAGTGGNTGGDFGVSSGFGQSFAGTFGVSSDFTMGLILARSDAAGFSLINPNLFGELTTLTQNLSYTAPQNTWQLMGSYQLGETSIGLAISYAATSSSSGSSGSVDSISTSTNFHQLGISAGAVWRSASGTMLDLDAMELSPTVSQTASNTGELSMTMLGINARAFLPLRDEFYLVPIFDFYSASGSSTLVATPKDLPSSTNIDAGIGVNFWQGGLHVMSGVSCGFYNQTTPAVANISPELSKSETIIPRWTIGVEWPMLRWLTARLGYFASSGTETDVSSSSASSTDTTSFSSANLYAPIYGVASSGVTAGVTFQIGRLNIDATISDDAFTSPSDIFKGVLFSFVTLGYRFE